MSRQTPRIRGTQKTDLTYFWDMGQDSLLTLYNYICTLGNSYFSTEIWLQLHVVMIRQRSSAMSRTLLCLSQQWTIFQGDRSISDYFGGTFCGQAWWRKVMNPPDDIQEIHFSKNHVSLAFFNRPYTYSIEICCVWPRCDRRPKYNGTQQETLCKKSHCEM